MNTIRELFDSSRALNRPIEKVISYQNRSDEQLRTEISEYVITEHIEECFEDLLKKMQMAKQGRDTHEIGVWVSGFYGSGKSSFTKYLGFALNREMKIGEDHFLHLLQNQLSNAGTKALFNQVSTVYNAEIIFLDLASEMLAGASMAEVSTVLYLKVLQWAGYSEDLKVAELERMLEAEGKLEQFKARAKEELDGIDWEDAHNQPLVANQIASRLANEFYPKIFNTESSFHEISLTVMKSEIRRAEEMIDLIRRKSGRENIIFIIDEVGQYVSAKPSLITNVDGLAKNLKDIGKGSVWLFATAQQTLTEDNPSAALNSKDLFKLKDRFPIHVHLEASDIKEICHRRLLKKSSTGEQLLSTSFDQHGASLRTSTALSDAGVYEMELNKKVFTDLYPFLPAHFEILLQLLGRLAKKTGGLGLRSAIKVIQEVLIEQGRGLHPLGGAEVGTLANTITFYDSLRRDILSSFGYVVEGVERVMERLPNEALCIDVAKSIAVLQILENLPVTIQNVAALLQPNLHTASLKDDVENAVETMLKDSMIPLGEKNGSLRFLTQAAVTLQKAFDQTEYRQADVRAEINGTLRTLFKPLPSARIEGTRQVTAGLRVMLGGSQSVSLDGEKEPIQLHVEFVTASSYDQMRKQLEDDSRSTKEWANLFLLGRTPSDGDTLAVTLVRCRKFLDAHRTASDPDTQEFIRIIDARLQRTSAELERKLAAALMDGSFISHGSHEAAAGHGKDITEAAKSYLAGAAAKIFDRYAEAPVQADSKLAEKFLKTPIDRITSQEDPLGLVKRVGGKPQVNVAHKALVSIGDYLRQMGQVEGRRLLDHFAAPHFGWSKDTTRYLLAGAFLGGEIKLRISGKDHQVRNNESEEAFASNRAIGSIGISLREEKVDPEALARCCDRLRDLTGEDILPLEDEIASTAKKHFSHYQLAFSPLPAELRQLDLSDECSERVESMVREIARVVGGNGSDVIKQLGSEESPLYDDLLWARNLKKSLDNQLRVQLSHIRILRRDINDLPSIGRPSELKVTAADRFKEIDEILARDYFFEEQGTLSRLRNELDKLVGEAVKDMSKQQVDFRLSRLDSWQESSDWADLGEEDRHWYNEEIDNMALDVSPDLNGLKDLLNQDFSINHRLRELESQLGKRADKQRKIRENAAKQERQDSKEDSGESKVENKMLLMQPTLESKEDIERLIIQLQDFIKVIQAGKTLKITCRVLDPSQRGSGNTYS